MKKPTANQVSKEKEETAEMFRQLILWRKAQQVRSFARKLTRGKGPQWESLKAFLDPLCVMPGASSGQMVRR